MDKNIILCGYMGSGKTTVGKLLAKRMKLEFVDTDRYIEAGEGKEIPQIFADVGEAGFREIEHKALKEVLATGGRIIATGGGMLTIERNAAMAKENGIIIFLNAGFECCYKRIKNSTRPIVVMNKKSSLKELYQMRKPVYLEVCDFQIDAGSLFAKDLAPKIEACLRKNYQFEFRD